MRGLIPPSAARSTVLSGNTPTYAAIPADAVRNTIKVNPQNIALLSRMAVGKLAKAAEGKGTMSEVCSRLHERAHASAHARTQSRLPLGSRQLIVRLVGCQACLSYLTSP